MADEISIYSDDNIQITNLRAMLQGKTYAMANVTSVSVFTQAANQAPGIIIGAIGGVGLAMGLGLNEKGGCFTIFGVILLIAGVIAAVSAKNRYWVRIGSASGETNALSSTNREYVVGIVNAMNEAIVRRG